MESAVFGIGNPLLDIQAEAPAEFLAKYGLKPADCVLAEEKHLPIYKDLVENYDVKYIAGGACQNSIRGCQWVLESPNATTYVGAVGADDNAKTLQECARKEGVNTQYYTVEDGTPTGVCGVIITDKERSMVTNLEAANKFDKKHLDSDAVQGLLAKAKLVYATGFFLTVSVDSLVALGEHCAATNKPFLMNLSAPFLIDFFGEQMDRVLPYVDYFFGNETEAAALGKKKEWGTDLGEIAKKFAASPKKNEQRKRTVIFTQGKDKTIVCENGEISEFKPRAVKPEDIVDTNGAGDSFVGGFLAGLAKGRDTAGCIDMAHYVASVTITRSGTNFEGIKADTAFTQ